MLSAAVLVACGDKVEVVQPVTPTPTPPALTGVSVVGPATYTLKSNPGTSADSLVFTANVSAEAGFDGARTVTWSSSDPAVFGIHASTGRGQAKVAGSTVITATSTVNNQIQGSIVLQVTAAPTGGGGPTAPVATISLGSINQGVNFVGLPVGTNVDATNIAGQVDVVVNVDYDPSNPPVGRQVVLELVGTSGTVLCDNRAFGTTPGAASADVVPVTLSCRTAAFSAAGVTTFRNGQYTLRACLAPIGTNNCVGQQVSSATNVTLNNQDFVQLHVVQTTVASGGRTATASGLWRAGGVQVQALPIMYTPNRTVVFAQVSLMNGGNDLGSGRTVAAMVGGAVRIGTAAYNAAAVSPLDIPSGACFAQQTFTGAAGSVLPANGFLTFVGGDSTTVAGVENAVVDTVIAVGSFNDASGVAVAIVRNGNLTTLPAYPAGFGCGVAPAGTSPVTSGNFIRLDNRDPLPSQWDPRVATQGANDRTVTITDPFPNAAWLGVNIGAGLIVGGQPGTSLPTTGSATTAAALAGNGLFVGTDLIPTAGSTNGVNVNTVRLQFAAVGTAKNSSAWTNLTAVTQPAETQGNIPTTYWIRTITSDALGNADTSRVSLNYSTAGGTVFCAFGLGAQGAPCAAAPVGGDPGDGTFPAATFGVDRVAPAASIVSGGALNGFVVSSPALACTLTPFAATSATANNSGTFACAAGALPGLATTFTFSLTEGGSATFGSFFGATPINLAIRRLVPHPTAPTLHVVECVDPNTGAVTQVPATERCVTMPIPSTPYALPAAAQTQGDYAISFSVADEANNRSYATGTGLTSSNTTCAVVQANPTNAISGTTTCLVYVVDPVIPVTASSPVSIPLQIAPTSTGTTTLATSGGPLGSFNDNIDLLGGNGTVTYPSLFGVGVDMEIVHNGSLTNVTSSRTGAVPNPPVRFDNQLGRTADVSVTLRPPTLGANDGFLASGGSANIFYRTLWSGAGALDAGGKPNRFDFRAWDSGHNLSMPVIMALPGTNISGGTNPFVAEAGVNFTTFTVASVSGATRVRTFTATLTAPATSLNTPFSKVCFYVAPPVGAVMGAEGAGVARPNFSSGGEFLLAGCVDGPTITDTGIRTYTYALPAITFPANYAGSGTWAVRAIGIKSFPDGADGIVTAAAVVGAM